MGYNHMRGLGQPVNYWTENIKALLQDMSWNNIQKRLFIWQSKDNFWHISVTVVEWNAMNFGGGLCGIEESSSV